MNGKTKTAKLLRRAIATGLALTLGSPVAAAMPQGGKVLAGGAGYTTAAGAWVDSKSVDVMNLHDGDKLAGWTTGAEKAAVIQWDSFDIASGEKLIIAYESGPMVNIVKSGAATTISGAIEQWNTKPCYIVNANGIDITTGAGLVKASNLFFSTSDAEVDHWKSLDVPVSTKNIDYSAAAKQTFASGTYSVGATPESLLTLTVAEGVSFSVEAAPVPTPPEQPVTPPDQPVTPSDPTPVTPSTDEPKSAEPITFSWADHPQQAADVTEAREHQTNELHKKSASLVPMNVTAFDGTGDDNCIAVASDIAFDVAAAPDDSEETEQTAEE